MLYENLTGLEREIFIEDARLENEFSKINTLLETIELQRIQNTSDAEFRVFSESGTNDDLVFLYEAAEKEATEAKKNLFKKVVEWFKKVLDTIVAKIKSIAGKGVKADADIKVSKETADGISKIDAVFNSLSSGVAKLKAGKFAEAWEDLKSVVIPAAIGAGAVTTAAVAYKKGKLDGILENIQSKVKDTNDIIKNVFDKLPDNVVNLGSKIIAPFKKFVSFASSIATKIAGAIASGAGKAADTAKEVAGKVADGAEKVKEKVTKESTDLYGVDLTLLDYKEEAVATTTEDDLTEDDDSYLDSILGL